MGQVDPSLGHHLDEIAKAELEPQIPANAENDYFTVEMPALEQFINAQHHGFFRRRGDGDYALPQPFAPKPVAPHSRKFAPEPNNVKKPPCGGHLTTL